MSEGKQKEKKHTKVLEVVHNAIESNEKIAALVMKGAKTWQKIIVYCCYGIVLAGIIGLSTPPYEVQKQLGTLAMTVVPLVIVAVIVLRRYKSLSPISLPSPWPLSEFKLQVARKQLEDTRKIAFDFLQSKEPALSDDDVRANVFYPEYDSPHKPKKHTLEIYPGLHCKMEHEDELRITFKPKQGATGQVFASGKPCVAKRLECDTGGWDGSYNITDDLAKIIHPDLKWIMSMPLKTGRSKPIGVMNVDGLKHDFSTDVLYDCMVRLLTNNVIVLSHLVISN